MLRNKKARWLFTVFVLILILVIAFTVNCFACAMGLGESAPPSKIFKNAKKSIDDLKM